MKSIKVKCPAKINLNLKVIGKRPDGFHNIESVMQTIDLYDYLDVSVEDNDHNEIVLGGMSLDIPYDERNIVYKAVDLFIKRAHLVKVKVKVFIVKQIPIAAGLGGGSSDAAGVIYALNKLYDDILSEEKMHELCAELGSDLNVCLKGGRLLCKGRGEIVEPLVFEPFKVSLIKPKKLGISAKDAYQKYAKKIQDKNAPYEKVKYLNDLEWAILDGHAELKKIKRLYPKAVMTGSGSTFYMINDSFKPLWGYLVLNDYNAIAEGISVVK